MITGASTGIGEATANLFAEKGATVFNLDVAAPTRSHPSIHFISCDVAKFTDVASAFQKILSMTNTMLCFKNSRSCRQYL